MIKEHPILFSTPMVLANLEGRKTMTRRIVSPRNSHCGTLLTGDGQGWHSFDFNDVVVDGKNSDYWYMKVAVPEDGTRHRIFSKYQVGDLLWVRETWARTPEAAIYKADYAHIDKTNIKWRPSIFLPKDLARIWLEVESIRVERLQDISPHDAVEEGVNYWNIDSEMLEGGELVADFENYTWTEKKEDDPNYEDRYFPTFANPVDSYRTLFQKINGEESWKENPWVWCISFKRVNHDRQQS